MGSSEILELTVRALDLLCGSDSDSVSLFSPLGFPEIARGLPRSPDLHRQHSCKQHPPEPIPVCPSHPFAGGPQRPARRRGVCQWLPSHGQCLNPYQEPLPTAALQLRPGFELPRSPAGLGADGLPKPAHALPVNRSDGPLFCRGHSGSSPHSQLSDPASRVQLLGLSLW